MRILITGGEGFIAREIITLLQRTQHEIIACVRKESSLLKALPNVSVVQLDFLQPFSEPRWLALLENVDVVINCVGVFHTVKAATMWQIHYHAPLALFSASVKANVKQIIHLSALGVDASDSLYAQSKFALETALSALQIDSVIVRPSFVYGKDVYGGSALFRGLAGMPGLITLPGSGEQLLQPIHLEDLARIVEAALSLPGKQLLCAVGPEKISLKNILFKLRAWLGFREAWSISMPLSLLKLFAKIGDLIPNSPLCSSGLKMLALDNVATAAQEQALIKSISFEPRSFNEGLAGMTSGVQDRWHARLFILRPLLQCSLAFIWLFSGAVSLITANSLGFPLLEHTGVPAAWQAVCLYGASLIDIILGLAILINFKPILIGVAQIALLLIYTTIISFTLPALWLHPFAPLAKNIPLGVAILIMMALASAR